MQGRISLNIGVVSTVPARKCPSLSSLHFLAGTVETTHHLATLCSPSDGSDYHGETLTKTPLWVEGSMFLHVRKMPVQFSGSNDCGICACCVAAACIRHLERAKAFDRTDAIDGKKLFAGAMLVGFTPEMFGRRARKHVSRTLKRDRFDWSDFVSACPISVALMDEDRK